MKTPALRLSAAVAAAAALLAFAGCSKEETDAASDAAQSARDAVTTATADAMAALKEQASKVEAAFASADTTVKGMVDSAVEYLRKQDYPAALAEFKKLIDDPRLTPAQKQSLDDLIATLKEKGSALVESAKAAAGQAWDATKDAADQAVEAGKDAAADAQAAADKATEDPTKKADDPVEQVTPRPVK